MYKPSTLSRVGVLTGWLIVGSLLGGCQKAEQTEVYTVPKHETLQTSEFLVNYEREHPKPERMIGLVLPHGSQLWFFKLQGNMEATAAKENDIREFLKSLTFVSDEKPEWKVPAGWRELPGSEMRYATLMIEGTPELELSVTKFPSRPDLPITEQVVMNINRWRGQLSLPPIDDVDLENQAEEITIANNKGYLINIVGRPKPKPPGMSRPAPQTTKTDTSERPAEQPSSSPFDYEKPEAWVAGPPTQFAAVSLRISQEDQKASVTVTAAGGTRLLNVNRWRGQVGLKPLSEEELNATAKKVEVGKLTGDLHEIVEGDKAILGVIFEDQGQTWYVKMMGDTSLVQRERERFEQFLKTLQWKA